MKKIATDRPALEQKALAKLPDSPWKEMLVGLARLHDSAIHEPNNLFDGIWVEIGPGYSFGSMNGLAFGHWDLVQTAMDALPYAPEYARLQLEHYFSLIYPDGMLPGCLYSKVRGCFDLFRPKTPLQYSHPPLWQEFVADYYHQTANQRFLRTAFEFGKKNFAWWLKERSALEGGFYYVDVVKRWWESGVDHGVRWDEIDSKPHSCIDASCHIHSVAKRLAEWADIFHEDASFYRKEAQKLEDFINSELWDDGTSFFYDIEAVRGKKKKIMTFEGFWPLALGIADKEKQKKLIGHLFNPAKFFTWHPVPSIALDEDEYSKSLWRGPAWNGPNFWIVRGCMRNGWQDEAKLLADRILTASAIRFQEHGTFFEYYISDGKSMDGATRKSGEKGPNRDYLGHNPLNAIYWEIFQHKTVG